jgi:hypothetical protein
MQSAIPAQERPARNVLIAVSHYARITPSHVERVARFSADPAVSYIERSILSLYIGNVESEKGLNAGFGCSGLFPVSEGHELIQNFLQSLEPPFLVGGCPPSLLCICVRFASLIAAISSRSFLIRSETSLGIKYNLQKSRRPRLPTQNRLDARSAVRCSNRVGCKVSNAFCWTF